jgi:DNA invertase Pin-like site-specific DNA recombinase
MPRLKNELLESRMMRKYPVRFGGRRTEKDAAGCPSLPWHYGPVNELRQKPYLAGRLPYIELCAIFRALLADSDGLYDPIDHNDRLLLGLTGIMSEAELHILRSRMRQGLLNKVARGEVFMVPSVEYVRSPLGGFDFDPDEQVRTVVRLVFDQFDRLGTIRKVLRYLIANDIRLGIRPLAGPNRGQLEWRVATRDTVSDILQPRFPRTGK